MRDVGIDTLTMEQYLPLTRLNQGPGVVKLEIGNNVNFEIQGKFIRDLRESTFFGTNNDDAYEHVERALDIVSLFSILGVTHDAVMLQLYCPPSKTTKQLEEIHNFKHKGDETLYQTWERGMHLENKCPCLEEVKRVEDVKYGEIGRPFLKKQ
ncbi:hypothetical protein Tco_0895753 [Tanacetum coccineum]|uniref:Uncharacterized protein n=1 Tax=Tanacetum coccineum TaxID=301880 RepID=A0ABQ5CIX5_9ASTR